MNTDIQNINLLNYLIENNTTTVNDLQKAKMQFRGLSIFNLSKEFIPHFSFGRCQGHTSAIIKFAKSNPAKRIAVSSFDIKTFNRDFGSFPNVVYLNTIIETHNLFNIKYIIFDYKTEEMIIKILNGVLESIAKNKEMYTNLLETKIISLGV